MATRNRALPTVNSAAQIRDNLPLTDPGLILKEKIRAAEAAAQTPALVKDPLTDPGLILKEKIRAAEAAAQTRAPVKDPLTEQGLIFKEKIHSGNKIPKGTTTTTARRSALTSFGPTPATTSSSKGHTGYKLRSHRTQNLASSENVASAPPLEEETGEPTEQLTKQQQQQRDLFGEDYELDGPVKPAYTPVLTESELETRSVDQLESYAVLRSQDVSQNIRDCVKVAEDTTGIASATMEMLHEQGGQIRRSHLAAVRVEEDLTVGEKLLGSLGGLFSRRWKPKKGAKIKGPQVAPDSYKKKNAQAARAAMLSKEDYEEEDAKRARARANKFEGLSATQVQLEMEREHQDEALSGLGDIVGKLKGMTYVMNEEVERQTADIGNMHADVDEIDNRVKQAYNRTRYLVGR